MPQNSEHPEYTRAKAKWQRCQDAYEGSDAVKGKATAYLPRLSDQTDEEYAAYVQRATFFGATERTVNGLTGAAVNKPFEVELPSSLEYLEEDATSTKMCLEELIKSQVQEMLAQGRIGLLVERAAGDGSQPYLVPYKALQIINWEEVDGQLVRVVLQEVIHEPDPKDPYAKLAVEQWRELVLDQGLYKQRIHRKKTGTNTALSEFETTETMPTFRGKALDFIPFVIGNASGLGGTVCKPPLLALVDINLSHYRTSADLEHGRHFTALPTPWVSGAKAEEKYRIGSSVAWILEHPEAKAGFLEFTGQGLGALEKGMAEKETQMAVLGARLLEGQKAGVEAEGTVRIRQSGDVFTLTTIAGSVADTVALALSYADKWQGGPGEVEVEANKDFLDTTMPPEEITALMAVYQGGGISLDTLLWNLQRGEKLDPARTIEEEKKLIEEEKAASKPDETPGALPDLTDEERAMLGLPPAQKPGAIPPQGAMQED